MSITNAGAIQMLLVDPVLQETIWISEVRESAEFRQLMDLIVRADAPSALILPCAAVMLAVFGGDSARNLLSAAALIQHLPEFKALHEEHAA